MPSYSSQLARVRLMVQDGAFANPDDQAAVEAVLVERDALVSAGVELAEAFDDHADDPECPDAERRFDRAIGEFLALVAPEPFALESEASDAR